MVLVSSSPNGARPWSKAAGAKLTSFAMVRLKGNVFQHIKEEVSVPEASVPVRWGWLRLVLQNRKWPFRRCSD